MKLRNAQVASMCLFCGGVRILRVEVVDLVPGSSSLLRCNILVDPSIRAKYNFLNLIQKSMPMAKGRS